jgi:hypothetical protein
MLRRLLLSLALVLALTAAPPARAQPAWYTKKKSDEQQQKQDDAVKAQEQPAIGGAPPTPGEASSASPFSELQSSPPAKVLDSNLLFRAAGLTESLCFDYGHLSQPEINGGLMSLQSSIGWWWRPDLIVGVFGRPAMIFEDTYLFMLISVGPEVRFMANSHWQISAHFGYAFSETLTRVADTHIPPPPSDQTAAARDGWAYGGQVAYLMWTRRDLALGPSLAYWGGTQRERTFSAITIGITLQDGRPNYTGDVTGR